MTSLQAGQTVRIQTDRGYDRLAMVIERAPQPNSYQVQAGHATSVRNRHHLLHTPEQYTPPTTTEVPLNTNCEPLPEPQPTVNQPQTEQVQELLKTILYPPIYFPFNYCTLAPFS